MFAYRNVIHLKVGRVSDFKLNYSYLHCFCFSAFSIFWSRNANSALFVVFINLRSAPAARTITDGRRHVFGNVAKLMPFKIRVFSL